MRNNEDRLGTKNNLKNDEELSSNLTQGINFIIPTEFVDLPSTGVFYPTNHPLKNKHTIEIKQMTAKEEDLLTSKSLLKKGIALDRLIQSLLIDKSIDPQSLTVEDRNAIVITARISGYGPEYKTQVTCPNCSEKSKYSFNLLNKLDDDGYFKPISYPVDEDGTFIITLPQTKWRVRCRAMNGYDEKIIFANNENKKKTNNDSFLLDQLKIMIVSIQDVQDKNSISEALEIMPAGDSRHLRSQYSEIVRSFDMKQNFVCNSCDTETVMEVPLSADFFWFK